MYILDILFSLIKQQNKYVDCKLPTRLCTIIKKVNNLNVSPTKLGSHITIILNQDVGLDSSSVYTTCPQEAD